LLALEPFIRSHAHKLKRCRAGKGPVRHELEM
jgi:hypothetical protein